MHARDDHSELLSLIEGNADAHSAESLNARLSREPALARLIEQMKQDREALRSLPEPKLPVDFSSRLETILARPMLIETSEPPAATRPGQFRRQYRKRTARIRWSRLALAAMVLLTASLGIWAVLSDWWQPPQVDHSATVANSGQSSVERSIEQREVRSSESLAGIVHHHAPARIANEVLSDPSEGIDQRVVSNVPLRKVQADFAIVLHGSETSAVENAVNVALRSLNSNAAIMRNFSYDEAQRLTREWRLAAGRREAPNIGGSTELPVASRTLQRQPMDYKLLALQVRSAILAGEDVRSGGGDVRQPVASESGMIAGEAELAPSLEQQLEFSSRGAMFTVAVPVAQLSHFIEQLTLSQRQAASLRMLPARQGDAEIDPTALSVNPISLWLTEGHVARQSIAQIERSNREAWVLVPVMIETSAERPRR